MNLEPTEVGAWAREHRACWEITPLIEMHRGEQVQVGFELDLFARIPTEIAPSEDRQRAVEAIWDRLRAIAESMLPLAGAEGRLDVEPFEAAGRLRPETQFAPEVLLKARLLHASDYFAPVNAEDRNRLKPIEERLLQLGLRARTW